MIYYGTETGTAKRYAENLHQILAGSHNVQMRNIASCDSKKIKESKDKSASSALKTLVFDLFLSFLVTATNTLGIFIVSTFGNGDPPTDAKKFTKELMELEFAGERQVFKGLRFSVLALGSSSYPNFCGYGKLLHSLLTKLGASSPVDLSLCDELDEPDNAFLSWVESMRSSKIIPQVLASKANAEMLEKNTLVRKKSLFRSLSINKNEFITQSSKHKQATD